MIDWLIAYNNYIAEMDLTNFVSLFVQKEKSW